MAEKKYANALKAFQQASTLDSNNAAVLYNEEAALVALDRNEEGLSVIHKAIQLFPEDSLGWIWRGIATYRLGNKENTLNDIEKAISLDKSNAFAKHIKNTIENNHHLKLGKY